MSFNEALEKYIHTLSCSITELSEVSGLSLSAISRYRSGERTPKPDGDALKSIAKGLSRIAEQKGVSPSEDYDEEVILSTLQQTLTKGSYSDFSDHFRLLISTLDLRLAELSRNTNYDASYLSRIRNGQRIPGNIDLFVENICQFIVKKYTDEKSLGDIALLLNCSPQELVDSNRYFTLLVEWFGIQLGPQVSQIDDFLKNLDAFDLDDYIRSIHFDELKVPSLPFQLPTSKEYYGLEQMKQGEIDFFKSTVLSKSKEPVFMCSDMPMEDMAEDVDFGKKWMFAIAMTIKKGLHIHIIHNIDRPFNEMMLGLQSWIPIYMTGQVSPYHLKNHSADYYHQLNYVSGAAALCGECISGHHGEGKYYLTNQKEALAYYRKKSQFLLAKASPLMEIYREENKEEYHKLAENILFASLPRHNIFASLPPYTIPEPLLEELLEQNKVSASSHELLREYVKQEKKIAETILEQTSIIDDIPLLTQEEYDKYPITFPLTDLFMENSIAYTYRQYEAHLNACREFANKHENYSLRENVSSPFRNIQIRICEDNWALISKSKAPTIHFLIRHEKMVSALQNFVPVIVE